MTTHPHGEQNRIDVEAAAEQLLQNLPPEPWAKWPGGWPGEIERAVLDAVFSVQARYGQPGADGKEPTGVYRVLANWASHRDVTRESRPTPPLDDLTHLAAYRGRGDVLADLLGNQSKIRGRLKAAIAAEVAARFLETDPLVGHAADWPAGHGDGYESLKRCWTGTPGLGPVTWSYVCMLLGHPDVKADTMIRRYLKRVLDLPQVPPAGPARRIVEAAAKKGGICSLDLDHAIWAWERRQALGD